MSLKAFTTYLSLEKNYSQHTIKAYANDISEFTDFCFDAYQIKSLTEVDYSFVRGWVVQLVNQGISNRTINRKISSLKAYYRFLQKVGEVKNNPLAKHKALKTEKKIQVPFSENEMAEVLGKINYSDDFLGSRDRLIIELLYTTGIRRAELVNLKLSNIDLDQHSLKVLGKRNKERIVPVIMELSSAIKSYIEFRGKLPDIVDKEYFLLTSTGHKVYETLVYRIINKYLSLVSPKVKKSPHMLRHTFATHLLNNGADLNAVKELLGHSSLASTQVYTHSSVAKLKQVHLSTHPRSKD